MPTWHELDEQFQVLGQALRHHRLQYQWGVAGIYYHLSGGPASPATARFEALATIAGAKIQQLPVGVVHDEVLQRPEHIERWYEAIRRRSGAFELGIFGEQADEAGNNLGVIYTGSVNDPAHASAIVALQFSNYDPAQPPGFVNVGQQGGVVNVRQHGDVHAPQIFQSPAAHQPKGPWWKSTVSLVTGLIVLLAAIATILTWLHIEPTTKQEQQSTSQAAKASQHK
jgi:hypothetical protein